MAKRENRSLNNFVECALLDLAYSEPNEETKAAIEEAKTGKLHGQLDVSRQCINPWDYENPRILR